MHNFVVSYSPYLGSSGLDILEVCTRDEVFDMVKTQLPDERKDSVIPFIPEESYYRVAIISDGMLYVLIN